jgi:cobalamin-dependent methionine synthase I
LACVAHEQHEIALQMLAIVFKLHSWDVHILGINISSVELIKASMHIKPDLIALTKVFSKSGSLDYLNAVARYTKRHQMRLLYGGSGWNKLIRERSWGGSNRIIYKATIAQLDTYLSKFPK